MMMTGGQRLLNRPSSAQRQLGYRGYQVLNYVHERIASDGRAPSYLEISEALDISSKAKVCEIVQRLEKRGLLHRVGAGRVRRIRLVVPA